MGGGSQRKQNQILPGDPEDFCSESLESCWRASPLKGPFWMLQGRQTVGPKVGAERPVRDELGRDGRVGIAVSGDERSGQLPNTF